MSPELTSVSPELALVDPGLAEWARDQLPTPPDTLEELGATRLARRSEPAREDRPRRRRSRFLTWSALLVLLASSAFLVGSRVDGETPDAAPSPTVLQPQPAAEPEVPASPVPPAATRRLAWAPVAGATAYHVELFQGPAPIFRASATKPDVVVPKAWRFGGRRRTLEPGTYRWYVWPIIGGERQEQAVVQAELVVHG